MRVLELPADYALVLQEIYEKVTEDFTFLAESLVLGRSRLSHVIAALQSKGLVIIDQDRWIRLSTKGKKLVLSLWPELPQQYNLMYNGFSR